MLRDSVYDSTQVAVFARQDGHTDKYAHGGAIQSEWLLTREGYHVGRETLYMERESPRGALLLTVETRGDRITYLSP